MTQVTISNTEIVSTIKPSEPLYWDQAPTSMDERHPIVVFRKDMTIIDGHHRFMYLRNSIRNKANYVGDYPVIFIDSYSELLDIKLAPSHN